MEHFLQNQESSFNNFDLFQFAVLNPQIAMLAFLKVAEQMASQPKKIENSQQDLLKRLIDLQKSFVTEMCSKDKDCIDMDCIEEAIDKKVFKGNRAKRHSYPTRAMRSKQPCSAEAPDRKEKISISE